MSARQTGFTLVELVIVMALVAIVASIGVGRLGDNTPYNARRFANEAAGFVGSAQRYAIAQRRNVWVKLTPASGTIALCLDSACAQTIESGPGLDPSTTTPHGISLTADANLLCFDTHGRPSLSADCALPTASGTLLTVGVLGAGVSGFAITVEAETGTVRIQGT